MPNGGVEGTVGHSHKEAEVSYYSKQRKDWVANLLTWIIVIVASAALWLWLLDMIFHFGYTGD